MKDKLNARQRKFAEYYAQSGNTVQSAIQAGYSENYANALQSLVAVVLNADDELNGNGIVEGLEVSVNFGEYANPSFESQVETVSKARQGGLMSVETSVDELYGDSKSEDWKAEEVQRIKEEQGIAGEEEKSELDDVDLTDTGNEPDKPEDIANQDDDSKWVSNE